MILGVTKCEIENECKKNLAASGSLVTLLKLKEKSNKIIYSSLNFTISSPWIQKYVVIIFVIKHISYFQIHLVIK